MAKLRESSCAHWSANASGATPEQINAGSMQRIADAVERIANDRDQERARADRLERSNRNLRGRLRREKARADAAERAKGQA
jgi:hypothetical protein